MAIGIPQLKEKYNKGENFFRTILCRPEFNQFRVKASNFFVFDDSNNFHNMLKYIINLKTKKYIILLFLLSNAQIAFCQHYEPIIIYDTYGEPQSILKGKIIYNNYGIPKNIRHLEDLKKKPWCYYISVRKQ